MARKETFQKAKQIISYILMFQLAMLFVFSNLVINPDSALATTSSFVQSNFSGGSSTSTASYPTNNTGWTNYYSKDSNITVGANVALAASSTTQTTDTDFNAGTLNQASVSGTGTGASVVLGQSWTEATSSAAWAGRREFGAVTFNNKLWIMGGTPNGSSYLNDVWSSSDGITWTEATTSANWSARKGFGLLNFNNKMWVFGGANGSGLNDVWSSSDGITWTEATTSANWDPVELPGALVFNNKMWKMGGYDYSTYAYINDVWSSSNGITWTEATTSANWSVRLGFGLLNFNNKMWVLGGFNGSTEYNDVWSSSDGITWTETMSSAGWSARDYIEATVFNNNMWVLGGFDGSTYLNDVWSWNGGYYSSGNLISSAINTGSASTSYGTISWDGSTPTGTTLQFQVATSSDGSTFGRFTGPDGTASTYYATSTGSTINSANNNAQYIELKAYLTTSVVTSTPELDDVTISYTSPGTLTSNVFDTSQTSTQINSLSWSATTPTNTNARFQIRTGTSSNNLGSWCGYSDCSGSTYFTSSNSGQVLASSHPLMQSGNNEFVQYKALLNSTDGISTPNLSSVTINFSLPPRAFSLSSPSSGSSQPTGSVSFSWGSSANANSYKLYVDKALVDTTSNTSLNENLSCGGHNWYVIATDGTNNTQSNSTNSLTISCPSVFVGVSGGGGGGSVTTPVQSSVPSSQTTTSTSSGQATSAQTEPSPANNTIRSQIADLLAQIQSLAAQLKSMGVNVNLPASLGTSAPFKINTNLSLGMRSDEVGNLQIELAKDKTIYPEGKITGYFGPATQAAVKRFQKKYGLPQVGRVGPATRAKLNEVFGK